MGNGFTDESDVIIEIVAGGQIILHHGWTEMGQGVDTVAQQMLCEAAGIEDSAIIRVITTRSRSRAGVTTASRATVFLGNAILDAAKSLRADRPWSGRAGSAVREMLSWPLGLRLDNFS